MERSRGAILTAVGAAIAVLLAANLLIGSVSIPLGDILRILAGQGEGVDEVWRNIILKSRLPQALTAIAAGAGLAVSGLEIQTVFRNPLAGPSVLGISSGASLGVACVVLVSGLGGHALSSLGYFGDVALTVAAIAGSMAVMALIAALSRMVRGNVTLLIIGVMIGYIANAVIGVLKFFSVEEDIRAYVIWGLGSFARVSGNQVGVFTCAMAVLVPLSMLLVKPLNILLLGDNYARNLGLNIHRARLWTITSAGVLIAVVTAYCGPVMFLGLAVPHLCRGLLGTSDHRYLMPAAALVGAALALLCSLIARMPGFEGVLPINSVTALIGAPVVISVLFRRRQSKNQFGE